MPFQIGDWVLIFGSPCRIVGLGKTMATCEDRTGYRARFGLKWIAGHQRGYWRGDRSTFVAPTQVEPYSWHHVLP
jgi:hypothetical protein